MVFVALAALRKLAVGTARTVVFEHAEVRILLEPEVWLRVELLGQP